MVFSRGQAGYGVPGVPWPQRTLTLRDDRRGVYRFDPRMEDFASLRKKGPFSFWGSMKYTFILSLMLWWIPLFGPMIAGYVGGRKAGNPWRGALAAIIPVVAIWIISLIVVSSVEFPELQNLFTLPALILYGFGTIIPPIEPYMVFLVDYLTAFVVSLQQTAVMGFNGYLVTIIFAYIGGLVAAQVFMERKVQVEEEPVPVTYDVRAPVTPVQPVQPMQPIPVVPAAPAGWYGVHGEQYDQFRRIPLLSPYEQEPEYEPQPPAPRQSRWRRRPPPPPPEEAYEPREPYEPELDARPRQESPSRRRARRLQQEDLIRRLVDRALRDYDQASR
ncbi:MAG: hypothetical protein ACE5I4_06120 [Thermoplasmata archaeon]